MRRRRLLLELVRQEHRDAVVDGLPAERALHQAAAAALAARQVAAGEEGDHARRLQADGAVLEELLLRRRGTTLSDTETT